MAPWVQWGLVRRVVPGSYPFLVFLVPSTWPFPCAGWLWSLSVPSSLVPPPSFPPMLVSESVPGCFGPCIGTFRTTDQIRYQAKGRTKDRGERTTTKNQNQDKDQRTGFSASLCPSGRSRLRSSSSFSSPTGVRSAPERRNRLNHDVFRLMNSPTARAVPWLQRGGSTLVIHGSDKNPLLASILIAAQAVINRSCQSLG